MVRLRSASCLTTAAGGKRGFPAVSAPWLKALTTALREPPEVGFFIEIEAGEDLLEVLGNGTLGEASGE